MGGVRAEITSPLCDTITVAPRLRKNVYTRQGGAPGWYGVGPLALFRSRAPTGRTIPAQGIALGHRPTFDQALKGRTIPGINAYEQ